LEKNNVNPNTKNIDGTTPALSACSWNQLPALTALIKNGANFEAAELDGTRVLILAVQKNHIEVIKFLISQGVDVNALNNNRKNALYEVLRLGHQEAAMVLLNATAYTESIVYKDMLLTLIAASKGFIAIFEKMLM
jgi:ankyrin repeat protein